MRFHIISKGNASRRRRWVAPAGTCRSQRVRRVLLLGGVHEIRHACREQSRPSTSLALAACGSDGGSTPRAPQPAPRRRPHRCVDAGRHRQRCGAATACSTARSSASSSTPARRSASSRRSATARTIPTPSRSSRDFWKPLADCTGVKIDFQGTDQFETEAQVRSRAATRPTSSTSRSRVCSRTLAGQPERVPRRRRRARQRTTSSPAGRDLAPSTARSTACRGAPTSSRWSGTARRPSPTKGYKVPTTLDELKALSDQIVKDGGTPWCAGIESGVATGWPITDWFEDFMLRLNGPDVYDQWVNHEIPFNDPKVKAVADAVGAYLKNPDYMGGENIVKAIATTKFQDGGLPITTRQLLHAPAGELLLRHCSPRAPRSALRTSHATQLLLPARAKAGGPKVHARRRRPPRRGHRQARDVGRHPVRGLGRLRAGDGQQRTRSCRPARTSTPSKITDPLLASFAELLASSDVFRFDGADHDARRRRVRHVLDRGHRMDRRWQHRRHAEQHREASWPAS